MSVVSSLELGSGAGIGFKSVFCATSTPIVHSGSFHFHFDSNALDGLGYLSLGSTLADLSSPPILVKGGIIGCPLGIATALSFRST